MTDDDLRTLGRDLAWDRPEPARREAVRAALVRAADAEPARRSGWGWAKIGGGFAAGALAAAAIAMIVARPSVPTMRAEIRASAAAELQHTIVGADELVRVHAGTVRIAAAEHVRVETHDATVDGGGEYEVAVARDQLASVAVHAGSARVTVRGRAQPVFLAAGETWHAAVATEVVATAPAKPSVPEPPLPVTPSTPVVPAPPSEPAGPATPSAPVVPATPNAPVVPATPSEPAAPAPPNASASPAIPRGSAALATPSVPAGATPRSPAVAPAKSISLILPPAPPSADPPPSAPASSPTERHFQAGWRLLRADHPREAAVELGRAADAGRASGDPLATDARYFQAVALVKAGASAEAERVLADFLASAPTSIRRGRAQVMLGRLLVERGERAAARSWFTSAARDPDPEVARAARAGLAGSQ